MKKIGIYFLLFFTTNICFSQNNHTFVSIEKQEQGKRVNLFLVNTGETDYEVFIKIKASGYRKIKKNTLTEIARANSKVKIASLIKITDQSNVSFGLIVNEIGHETKQEMDTLAFTFDTSKKHKPVIIFIKDYCTLCESTIKLFSENNMIYTVYNIDEDIEYYTNIKQELLNRNKKKTSLVPIIKVEDSIYNQLNNNTKVIQALKNHY